VALFCAVIMGGCAGAYTGFLHTKLGLNKLVAGIVTTTMLFSVSMNISGANIALGDLPTLFSPFAIGSIGRSFFLFFLFCILACGLIWYMRTQNGYILRATGENPQFVVSLGKSVSLYTTFALILANSFSALSGALMVQYTGFFSIFGNIGVLVSALAGCMIAELFQKNMFLMAFLGALVYQVVISLTIELEIPSSWQRFLTGLLVVVILVFQKKGERV
jgi:putative ABC transport system permease protein